MADIRALLKAKRQESRIVHPFATYTPSGQLKCVICGTLIKHASAWEGHLGSKLHRTNVTRSKEEKTRGIREEKIEEKEQTPPGKRKAETNESDRQRDKKRRTTHSTHELPNDFFSDPSHVPVLPEFPSDDSDDDANVNPAKSTTSESQSLQAPSTSALDLEYDLFKRGFLEATDHSQTYQQATIVVEPVLASPHIPGFPTTTTTTVLAQSEGDKDAGDYEERELIMDRLLEEERAQEDADMRVHLMKNKVEGLKKRREAIKALKVQAGKSSSRM